MSTIREDPIGYTRITIGTTRIPIDTLTGYHRFPIGYLVVYTRGTMGYLWGTVEP